MLPLKEIIIRPFRVLLSMHAFRMQLQPQNLQRRGWLPLLALRTIELPLHSGSPHLHGLTNVPGSSSRHSTVDICATDWAQQQQQLHRPARTAAARCPKKNNLLDCPVSCEGVLF